MAGAIGLCPAVSLDGQALPAAWQAALLELRVERHVNVPGRVTLRLVDPGYELLGGGTCKLGTTIEVVDPVHNTQVLLTGEVTGIACEQREGEQPELVVVGHDKSHRMGRTSGAQTYLQMSYRDVVTKVAGTYGLSPSVSVTASPQEYLLQVDSDLGMLGEMARRCGADWWVEADGRTLKFASPGSWASAGTLALGSGLRSFSARASGHRPDTLQVEGWDRDQQSLVTGTSTTPSQGILPTSDLAGLVARPGDAFGVTTMVTTVLGALVAEEATQLSQAQLDRQAATAVEARGVADGNGGIGPGTTVDVTGAGPLSGTYPVTGVEHLYRPRSGYVTRFRSGDRQPAGLADAGGPGRGEVAGHGPSVVGHAGVTVGVVTNINDPDKAGRVKVRFPGLSDQQESGWARVATVGGGAARGNVFIPEVNDEVLVGFEGGDSRTPVVIGGLYGQKSTIPPPDLTNGQVQTRAMTSRLGHVVQFLDGSQPDKQAIELTLAGGQTSMHMGQDKLTITVPSGKPMEIAVGNTKIAVDAAGALTMSATSISLKADQQLQLQAPTISVSADAQLTLQGQATAALKGANVQVQAEGPLQATGAPVMIN